MIRKLVFDNTGISLANSKQALVKRRFAPRLKKLGISNFTQYIQYVQEHPDREIGDFCNAITTNLTSFFREYHHYEYLKDQALPTLIRNKLRGPKKIRVWSAGCSTGQEAYCLAMILRSSIPAFESWDVKVLASDLDEKCLQTAKAGIYSPENQERVRPELIDKYFKVTSLPPNMRNTVPIEAKDELKKMITFNRLNLVKPDWPMKGQFDIIFCRNVFIYFDKNTQHEMLKRFGGLQAPGNYLFLGHSESISNPPAIGYRLVGKTTYIKE